AKAGAHSARTLDGESARRLLATGSWERSSLVHLAAIAMVGELPLMAQFELMGTQVAQGRMSPLPIVEQLNVFEDCAACLGSGTPVVLINQFELEGGEKTFRHRVIPAVAFTTHAAQHAVRRQQLLILVTGVLAAAVGVMQQALRW